MYGNVISALSQFLTPEFVAKMATVAGIPEGSLAPRAVAAAAPAILSGMACLASKPEGARRLADVMARQPPDALETLASVGGSERVADTGQNLLSSLLGGTSFASLASAVGKFSGVGDGAVRSLLGMLTPVILGVLGREAGAGATGVAQLLASQRDEIAAAMPRGLSDLLGRRGFPANTVASVAGRANEIDHLARNGIDTTSPARRGPQAKSSNWLYWVLPLLALAGLGWYLLGGERRLPPAAVGPTATSAPASVQGAPTNSDLARQITATIDSLGTSLQRVKDPKSAADALPQLRQTAGELDRLSGLVNRLPLESRDRLAETIKTTAARLKSTLGSVSALPGTAADVKSTIAALQTRLDSLVLTPGSLAQPRSAPVDGKVAFLTTVPRGAVSLSKYFNRDVYNNENEKIGMVKDLIVGPDERIAAAIVGVGGFLGIGEKDVALAFTSIRLMRRDNDWRLVADASKEALKDAPNYREINQGTRSNAGSSPK
jgi:hypothetical protein